MSSKTYIIAWDKALENCLEIDRQLSGSGLEYKFLNVSSDKTERPNWEISDDVRYYGHFYNSLKDFLLTNSNKVFGFNAGDPEYSDYPNLIKKAERVLENPGIYAPNMKGDLFSESGVYLEQSKLHPELYLATQTNGMCVFMHRQIASVVFNFMTWIKAKKIDFSTMHSGWGLDTVYCLIAMYTNLPIYRDTKIYVYHPPGSIYPTAQANKEMSFIENMFMQYSLERGWSVETLKFMKEHMFIKARQRANYNLSLNTMYPNLEGELEQ